MFCVLEYDHFATAMSFPVLSAISHWLQIAPLDRVEVYAGKHDVKITIGVWQPDEKHYKLYCNTLVRVAGQDYSVRPTMSSCRRRS